MRNLGGTDRLALAAGVLATLGVTVMGTGLSVVLGGFAQGFLALGFLSLTAAGGTLLWTDPESGIAHRLRERRVRLLVAMSLLLAAGAGLAFAFAVTGRGDEAPAPESRAKDERSHHGNAPHEGPGDRRLEKPGETRAQSLPEFTLAPREGEGKSEKSPGTSSAAASPPSAAAHPRKPASGTRPSASPATAAEPSSPVAPILIAIVVLAAISIGTVLYRHRRGRRTAVQARR